MSREDRLVERSCQKRRVSAFTRAWWLVLSAFAIGCSSEPRVNDPAVDDASAATMLPGPNVNDSVVDDTPAAAATPQPSERRAQSSQACWGNRTPITDPDGALLATLERLAGSYPIGGAWGAPAQLDFKPKEAPFEGELVVSRRNGDLIRVEGCGSGIEVPVAVAVRTNDGALAERAEGTVLLANQSETTIDGAPVPFRAQLSAVVDLGALSGTFSFADDPSWTFGPATLRAELTPFGTRGTLGANIEPKGPYEPGSATQAPSSEPLLSWHGADGCVGSPDSEPDPALFPAPTEARAALDLALERAATKTYRAKYSDGTETQVALEFAPLSLLCATNFWASYWHFPTRAHLKTDDGRLDVSIGVTIDPGFSQLHYNQLDEVPWAYPPARVERQIGHIDVALSDYAHVGIESWFDVTPEPAGWIKVLGYDDGACDRCDEIGGCIECAFDKRVEILSLFIGAESDKL